MKGVGFLQAVYSLGENVSMAYENSPLADIIAFLQLPYPLTEDENGKVYVIRVWLEVTDPQSEVLDIKGVADIDRIEYQAISTEEIEIKERCLYRDPVGSNVSWRFSPLYKLGKGNKDSRKDLLGESGNWQNNKGCRLYKLYHNLLKDYEDTGYFTEGNTDKIMTDLVNQVDRIAEFWSDRKIPCFFLFGLKSVDGFLYPGETPAFIKYFREKLNSQTQSGTENHYCSLCGEETQKVETLDKVFKFATFDKPGFLPGTKAGSGVKEKVFPVCESCYATLSAGKEEMEKRFVNFNTVPNISLYVIPEIVTDRQAYYRMAADFTKDFLRKGIRHEPNLFRFLSKHNEGLVYHFLFAETNQAQLIVHSFVEDVPPTRLRKLQELWQETCDAFDYELDADSKKGHLDTAILQIVAVMLSLAGKREQDKTVMRDKIIALISGLLNGETVGIKEIKTLMVSRLAGQFTDPDWLRPKEKGKMPGRLRLKGMAEVVDFLYRVNNGRG